jgi:hypothetical protein
LAFVAPPLRVDIVRIASSDAITEGEVHCS